MACGSSALSLGKQKTVSPLDPAGKNGSENFWRDDSVSVRVHFGGGGGAKRDNSIEE